MHVYFIFDVSDNLFLLSVSLRASFLYKGDFWVQADNSLNLPFDPVSPDWANTVTLVIATTAIMPGEDKPQQHTRQRKKNKKSRSKGKSPGGSPTGRLGGTIDSQDDLLLQPVPQPPPKKLAEERPKVSVAKVEEESSIAICLQVLFPYLLAGMGMVMAGMVLDNVQVSAPS